MKRRIESSFVLFDVTYDDGSRTSRRKVPSTVLEGLEGEDAAKVIIEEQDREIGLASGRPRGVIKSMMRSRT
jgi:hypothetical protein